MSMKLNLPLLFQTKYLSEAGYTQSQWPSGTMMSGCRKGSESYPLSKNWPALRHRAKCLGHGKP